MRIDSLDHFPKQLPQRTRWMAVSHVSKRNRRKQSVCLNGSGHPLPFALGAAIKTDPRAAAMASSDFCAIARSPPVPAQAILMRERRGRRVTFAHTIRGTEQC
jgi:hypothetical protein